MLEIPCELLHDRRFTSNVNLFSTENQEKYRKLQYRVMAYYSKICARPILFRVLRIQAHSEKKAYNTYENTMYFCFESSAKYFRHARTFHGLNQF